MSNKTFYKIILKNEQDANRVVANVMSLTFLFFSVIYLLNIAGVFVIDSAPMSIAYFSSAVLLLLPQLINRLAGTSSRKLKYIYVSFTALFILIITSVLTYHVVVVYAFPIAIAGMYFSKRVTRFSSVITLIVTTAGQFIAFFIGRTDDNFTTLRALVVYGVLPRFMILLCFAALLEHLTARTSALLKEDSENYEQQVLYSKNMIYGFASLVESRDESTGGHIKRTGIYSSMLAEKLREKGIHSDIITEDFINCIATVAPLHDIGKISIPDNVLCKPGRLTDEEYAIMRSHSAKGGEIIKETLSLVSDENYRTMAYEVARFHHEKWNGKGYPDGLSGTDIPLAARIMAVADVFDAVSEKRCYREAMSLDQCFDIIAKGIGTDFDPDIAEAFLEMREEITAVRENNRL